MIVFVFTIIQVRLILNKKKGFVKLALRCGVSLVPTFSFGEAAIYDKVGDSWRVKHFLIACVLTAGEQGGFRSEEHPGLSDFNSWVCSGRLPRSRHLPVQFWNCPTQVSGKHFVGVVSKIIMNWVPESRSHWWWGHRSLRSRSPTPVRRTWRSCTPSMSGTCRGSIRSTTLIQRSSL